MFLSFPGKPEPRRHLVATEWQLMAMVGAVHRHAIAQWEVDNGKGFSPRSSWRFCSIKTDEVSPSPRRGQGRSRAPCIVVGGAMVQSVGHNNNLGRLRDSAEFLVGGQRDWPKTNGGAHAVDCACGQLGYGLCAGEQGGHIPEPSNPHRCSVSGRRAGRAPDRLEGQPGLRLAGHHHQSPRRQYDRRRSVGRASRS